MSKCLSGLCVWICLGLRAWGWNAEGHMVVAQIAYNHLDPAVKARCDALIAVPLSYQSSGTSNFVTAAVWADDFKSQLGTAIWHYIDLPFSLDGTPTSGVAPASFDVVRAINLCVSTLQDTNATQTDQATYLRYLLHFVGDIQQPLHCSDAVSASHPSGDAGGNSFNITGTWNNLHSLWDAGGGFLTDSLSRPLSASSQNKLNSKVSGIEADYPYVAGSPAIPDPMNWAQEGFGLAQTVAYVGITNGSAPTMAYTNTAQATTEQRMAMGGHRLADLLNTLFASNAPVQLAPFTTPDGGFGLSWSAIPGRTYRVQWKEQLSDAVWNDWTNVTASGGSVSVSEVATQAQRFYRVAQ
jgi:hypothetical protein